MVNLLSRRFPTILGLFIFILMLGGSYWLWTNNLSQTGFVPTPSKVRITNVADNKFTVSFITDVPTSGEVEYGVVGEQLTERALDDRDLGGVSGEYLTHHVTVEGLQPNTSYAFRIIAGGGNHRFDNNGSPYSVTTGPTIAATPVAKSLYGEVGGEEKDIAGSIVYVTLPGSAPASTLVTSSGNYSLPISVMRTADLSRYIEYDQAATLASVTVEGGGMQSVVTVNTANIEPVPKIILGQNADYSAQSPVQVAQVEPTTPISSTEPAGNAATVFNVEPLEGSENLATGGTVTILNPGSDGETLASTRPEFRGMGPVGTVISLTIHSTSNFADTVVVNSDGTWTWSPPTSLAEGQHTITLAYVDLEGVEQTISRIFTVSSALAESGEPSFEATPSATKSTAPSSTPTTSSNTVEGGVSPTPSPSPSITSSIMPSPSPREQMPSTESGVPVSGIVTPTMLTALLGILVIVSGALLLGL